MLNQDTRDQLNDQIYNIKFYEARRHRYADRRDMKRYQKSFNDYVEAVEEFERTVCQIWARNLCDDVRKSLQYYIRKAGLLYKIELG